MGILFSWGFVQLGFRLCCARLLTNVIGSQTTSAEAEKVSCGVVSVCGGTPMQTQICYNPHSGPGTYHRKKGAWIFWEAPASGSGYREFQLQKGLDAKLMPAGRLMASGYNPKNLHPQTVFRENGLKGIEGRSCTPSVDCSMQFGILSKTYCMRMAVLSKQSDRP